MNRDNQLVRAFIILILAILFLVIGFYVVTYAAGYKFDITSRELSKTGLISIQTKTDGAQIYLDSKLVGQGGITLRSLEPGNYNINIKKAEFNDWSRIVDLEAEQAVIINDITLFRQKPEVSEYKSSVSEQNIVELADRSGLKTLNGEIMANDKLVTRLATNVTGLSWYPSHKYIAFTSDNRLKIIDLEGTNLVDLVEKNSQTPVMFTNSGKSVIFENNGKIYQSQIR